MPHVMCGTVTAGIRVRVALASDKNAAKDAALLALLQELGVTASPSLPSAKAPGGAGAGACAGALDVPGGSRAAEECALSISTKSPLPELAGPGKCQCKDLLEARDQAPIAAPRLFHTLIGGETRAALHNFVTSTVFEHDTFQDMQEEMADLRRNVQQVICFMVACVVLHAACTCRLCNGFGCLPPTSHVRHACGCVFV